MKHASEQAGKRGRVVFQRCHFGAAELSGNKSVGGGDGRQGKLRKLATPGQPMGWQGVIKADKVSKESALIYKVFVYNTGLPNNNQDLFTTPTTMKEIAEYISHKYDDASEL